MRAILRDARLYAITPDDEPARIEALVGRWLRAGVRLVQLRHKELDRGGLLALARRLVPAVTETGGALIVNDHADIAMLAGAHGVHLGPDDLSVAGVRRVAGPELVIGASAQRPEDAEDAVAAGADYIGSGPAFPTSTKTSKSVIGPAGIARVAAATEVPVFAIGGITPDRVAELRQAGISRLCAISALAVPGAADAFLRVLA